VDSLLTAERSQLSSVQTVTEWSCCPQNKCKLEARNMCLEEEKRLIQVLGPVKAKEETLRLERVGLLAEEH